MARNLSSRVLILGLVLLAQGCYTKVAVQISNRSAAPVRATSSSTGSSVRIAAGGRGTLPHVKGALTAATSGAREYNFDDVNVFDLDRKLLLVNHNIFGPNQVILPLELDSNMVLRVAPKQTGDVSQNSSQPPGYPKIGRRLR